MSQTQYKKPLKLMAYKFTGCAKCGKPHHAIVPCLEKDLKCGCGHQMSEHRDEGECIPCEAEKGERLYDAAKEEGLV